MKKEILRKKLLKKEPLKNYESAENYLETIFILSQRGGGVRSVDIAKELDFSKPSVSVAMKNLREKGHVEMDEDGYIVLTGSGQKIAESVYERHVLLSSWLIRLGVDKETALDDACRMEHVMSERSFLAIKEHIKQEDK